MQKEEVKRFFMEAINGFRVLINDHVLEADKTEAYRKNEEDIFKRILVYASELEKFSPGEAMLYLIILSLRTHLKLKSKILELELKIRKLELEDRKNRRTKG